MFNQAIWKTNRKGVIMIKMKLKSQRLKKLKRGMTLKEKKIMMRRMCKKMIWIKGKHLRKVMSRK